MKIKWTKFVLPVLIIAVGHFCFSWIAFMRSEILEPTAATEQWKLITSVLAFPLIYLSNFPSAIDLFAVLMIGNSLLWAAAIVFVLYKAFQFYRCRK